MSAGTTLTRLLNYFSVNYTLPGLKTMSCTVNGTDGSETKSLSFSVDGLSVLNYDTLWSNASRRVVGFDAVNDFHRLEANISVTHEGGVFSRQTNVSAGEHVLVFAEVNTSAGAERSVAVQMRGGSEIANYTALFDVESVVIDAYDRIEVNATRLLSIIVRNVWDNGSVSWNLSDPALSNSSSLAHNGSLLVLVEHNYSQGLQQPTFTVSHAGASKTIRDSFLIEPLSVSIQTLAGGVSEMLVNNTLSSMVSWRFDTGLENVSNTTNSSTLLVFVQGNYSAGVYRTQGFVNSSGNSDNQSGVVVA